MDVSMRCWFACVALCIGLLVMSGPAESADMKKSAMLASADAVSYYFTIEIMNRIYNHSLLDPNSPDYKKMYSEVNSTLYFVYGCPSCGYQGVTDMSFSNGSVIADFIITFQGSMTNPTLLRNILTVALNSNNEINGLQINSSSVQGAYVTTTTPATTTTRATTPTTTTSTTRKTTTPTTTTTKLTTITTTTSTTPTTTSTTTATTTTTTPSTTTLTKTPTTTTTSTTPKITTATSEHSLNPPIVLPTKRPKPNVSTTTTTTTTSSSTTNTKSSSSTISSHSINSPVTHNRVTNSSSNNNKDNKTEPVFTPSTPSSNHSEGVPGWAIALLVLAAIAILLLIIIIIILLVRWCCVDNGDDVRSLPPQEHTPYMRTTFREPLSVPAYSPHTPQKNLYPFDDLPQSPKPKPNRTGTYVVNPER